MFRKCFFLFLFSLSFLVAKETASVHEFFDEAVNSFQDENWNNVIRIGKVVIEDFSDSAIAKELYYYVGVSYFHKNDFDLANRYLSSYLKKTNAPHFFEEAMQYKFLIAEKFRNGAKKHLVKWEKSPSWLPAKEDALEIYDEIINTFPFHELAARSLYGKAQVHKYFQDFREAIDSLQIITQKFPKHEFANEAYLEIGNVYLLQCKTENLDPNILDLALVNYQKFCSAFPGEKRLEEALQTLYNIQEEFAVNFYETGKFYERTKKKNAAIIYYSKILSTFPNTKAAKLAKERLDVLQASN